VDEVIVVDGLSHDGTLDVAKQIAPDVIAVRELRRGKGAAMRAGFAAARGDYLVVLDADGSMDPAEIERYVHALDAGFDLVKGSRYLEGGGSTDLTAFRSFGNSALRTVANLLFNTKFTELCYGFFALRRDCLARMALDADGFEIETQTVIHAVTAGLRITEVPSSETPRLHGESNLHPIRDGIRIVRVLLQVRTRGMRARTRAAVPFWQQAAR
jgi:glycosyltransferase involved in cell wall biosynthesis